MFRINKLRELTAVFCKLVKYKIFSEINEGIFFTSDKKNINFD